MTQTALSELTMEELLQEAKKRKQSYYMNCGIVGFMAGIACYSTVRNGFGFFTFLPLIAAPMAARSSKEFKAVKQEIASRNAVDQS